MRTCIIGLWPQSAGEISVVWSGNQTLDGLTITTPLITELPV